MPYIEPGVRPAIDSGRMVPRTAGELTYAMTRLALNYVEQKGTGFTVFAEVLAALDATAREFYRRVVAPYEDIKISENGDVYPQPDGSMGASKS